MEEEKYLVVRNDEGQYSLWIADQNPPPGWSVQGEPGSKEACLEYVRIHWTDMTPLSIRR